MKKQLPNVPLRATLENRRANLRRLADQHFGGITELIGKLGINNASYWSQMMGPNPRRPVSEKNARAWEQKLKLPYGWLDVARSDEKGG